MYQHLQKYSNVTKCGYYMNNVHRILFLKAQELQTLLPFFSSDISVTVLLDPSKQASLLTGPITSTRDWTNPVSVRTSMFGDKRISSLKRCLK